MNRIIIMLAGALLATTAHAQLTLTDLDIAVEKLETEIGKVATAVAALPTGRRIAMYSQPYLRSPLWGNGWGRLTAVGTAKTIEGITHNRTGVTVPAGTYAITVESDNHSGPHIHAGAGTPTAPLTVERLSGVHTLLSARVTSSGIFTFATATRIYLGGYQGGGSANADRGSHTLLTIEQL